MISLTVVIVTFVVVFGSLYLIMKMNGAPRLHRHGNVGGANGHHPHRKMRADNPRKS